MQLRAEQLESHLAKGLAPIYVISGDEPLQIQELGDAIRARSRSEGFTEREVLNVERGFDWNQLRDCANNLSLFAERRLLEVRMAAKPGDDGARALAEYAAHPPADTALLLTCAKLDKNTTARAKWFQALAKIGVVIQVWPVGERELPEWIQRRMRARGLQPSSDAVAMLADRVEGNLLAAAQEIEKLALLHTAGRIDVESIAAAVADSARFNVFGLVDSALAGKSERCARMLGGLRGEGVAPVLLCWALTREVRTLTGMAADIAKGQRADAVLTRHRVWDRRKPLINHALRHRPVDEWYDLLRRCAHTERVIKGAAVGKPWDELLQLTLMLSGLNPMARSA